MFRFVVITSSNSISSNFIFLTSWFQFHPNPKTKPKSNILKKSQPNRELTLLVLVLETRIHREMFFDFIPFPSVLLVALCEIFPFSLLFFHSYFRSISLFPSCEIINPYDKKKPFTTKKSSILQPQRPYSLNPILNNLYPFHQYNTQPPRPITFLKTIQIIITQIIHWSRLQHHKNRHQNMQKPTHTKTCQTTRQLFPKTSQKIWKKSANKLFLTNK